MQDFYIWPEKIDYIQQSLQNIQDDIEESYTCLTTLLEEIESGAEWEGLDAKETFLIYMRLMDAYHRAFTDNVSRNPLDEAIEALTDLGENVDAFYEDMTEYQDLGEIS